jgi:tetratricopeptide (TPR) repeat protein
MPQKSIVMCLDSNIDQSNNDNTNWITEVQRIVDSVHASTDVDDCIDFLTKIKNEKVFMIVSITLDRRVISLIGQFAQVDSIYIICSDRTIDETWVSELKKVKGAFAHIKDICDLLKRDIQSCDNDSIPIYTTSENDAANSPTSEHDQSLSYIQSNMSMKHNTDNRIMRAISSHASFAHILENIVVICLDSNNDPHEDTERKWFTEVQRVVNIVNTFTDVDECVDFLTEIENENVLMIVSGDYSMHVISHVKNFHQLKSVYVLSRDKALYEVWTNKSEKMKGVFTEIRDILPSLIRDIRQCDRALVPISIIRANDSASIALNELDQSFMYTQLVKEILLEIKFDNESKQYFIDFCRRQYRDCDPMLQAVTFIYSILNRAFRTQEINIIMKMGFFMQDLYHQIEHLYKNWSDKPSLLTVYRGQGMLDSEFERLRKGKGGLVSFNNFLSTSVDKKISFLFADSARSDPDLVGVLFEIAINPELSSTPFISLDNIGHYLQEQEILFSMHSIFQIGEAHQIDKRLWQVELLSTTDNDNKIGELTDYMRKTTIIKNPWLRLGHLLMNMGEFTEAEQIFQALNELDARFDANQSDYLDVLHALGMIKYQQSDSTQALLFLQKALQLSLPNSTNFAVISRGIALVHAAMGNYSAALLTHKKSLEILQKATDVDLVYLATSHTYVGDTYIKLGRPWDAISDLKKSVEIHRKTLPSNHPSFAINYNWMGEAYRLAGDYSRAFYYYEKALKIQEKYLPPNHIELAHTINGMGLVYERMGDYSSALFCFQKRLQIQQNSLNLDHPELAKTYNNIGLAFNSMRNYLKALSSYQMALNIYEKFVDLTLPDLAITYHNVAVVFCEMGNYSTALGFFQKTLGIEQKSLSPDHPTLGTTYCNIAGVHKAMGDYSTALSFLERAREIQEKCLHFNHPELAEIYSSLAAVHTNMGDYSIALSFLEKSREIQEKSLHPSHLNLATTYNNLAVTYRATKDYLTALSFFQKASIIQEKHLHSNHSDLAVTFENIASLYREMGDNLSALLFLHKARQIRETNFRPNDPAQV